MLLAAYGRHGMASAELQTRWGIAVEYFRFMGLGLVMMVVVLFDIRASGKQK